MSGRSRLRWFLEAFPWLLALTIFVVTVSIDPAFRLPRFWLNLAQQYFAPVMLALVLTPIVLTGGIDLSVGSVTVCVAVVVGVLLQDAHWPIAAALLAGLLFGMLAGLLNGVLVVLGVVPLVATLATRELFRGLALSVGGDTGITGLPVVLMNFWRIRVIGIPIPLLVIALSAILLYVLIHHTWIGRMVYALGDNEEAARFAGVPVRRLKLGLYTMSGFVAGICGVALTMRFGSVRADAEKTLEMTAIACVVLGGIRITGGAGHAIGALLGTLTVVALLAELLRLPPNVRDVVLGTLLLVVAVLNEAARRWADRLG